MSNEVTYERLDADKHVMHMDSPSLPDISIDYTGIPLEERGGTSVKLLGAASLYCFAATLGAALTARGADVKSLRGSVSLEKGRDEIRRTKVTDMTLSVEVDIDDKDEPILEKCRKIMERGCLITYTLEESIEIEYEISRRKS